VRRANGFCTHVVAVHPAGEAPVELEAPGKDGAAGAIRFWTKLRKIFASWSGSVIPQGGGCVAGLMTRARYPPRFDAESPGSGAVSSS